MVRNWYEIRNAAADVAELWIYDYIGIDFWTGEGVSAKQFAKDLAAITAPAIDLHINSPGGSVFDGQAIHTSLVNHPATVTTYVDGLAASIASVVALAGNKVVMAANALFMIHNPMGCCCGAAGDMRDMADLLDKVGETIAGVYERKTGLAPAAIRQAMDAETWYTAEEALDAGFADEIGAELPVAACAKWDLSSRIFGYKHAPADAGRVLSAANEAKITEARDNLNDVLAAVSPEDATETEITDAGGSPASQGVEAGGSPVIAGTSSDHSRFLPGVGIIPEAQRKAD